MRNVSKLHKIIMSLTPEVLLSVKSREQCIAKLHELPLFVTDDKQKKRAAVLVPLCVINNEVCLLYTLRSSALSSHSGQVSFPGGKMDEGETIYETALRETEEEIGFPPKDVDIWGRMCQVQGRNKEILITPVVGELKNFDINKLQANESEVAEIFTVPLKTFCDQQNHGFYKFNKYIIPVFTCGNHKVWGITGLITHFFLQSLLPKEVYEADLLRKEYVLDQLLPAKL